MPDSTADPEQTVVINPLSVLSPETENQPDKTVVSSSRHQECNRDPGWFVKWLILLFGLSSLLPWNVYINAAGLFKIRLKGTRFEYSYPNYVQAVGIISNLLGSGISVFLSKKFDIRRVIVVSNIVLSGPIGFQCILTGVDTSAWQEAFFLLSLLVLVLSALGHSAQTSNMSAMITMTYSPLMVWYYTGKGIAGIVAVCLTLITVSFPGMGVESAALYYFIATFILCFVIVTLLEIKFVSLPMVKDAVARQRAVVKDINDIQLPTEKTLTAKELVLATKGQSLASFLISFVSLVVFPALSTKIEEYNPNPNSKWSTIYFQPIMIFLSFALGDSLGKVTSGFCSWPGKKLLVILSVVRLILIPLILMCNVQRRSWPIWFKDEAFAPIIIFVTGVTGGHFINLNLMYAPTYFEGTQNKGRISTVMFFFLSTGMATASCVIFGLSELIQV